MLDKNQLVQNRITISTIIVSTVIAVVVLDIFNDDIFISAKILAVSSAIAAFLYIISVGSALKHFNKNYIYVLKINL